MCEERRRLLQNYQAAVDRYLDAIRALQVKTASSSKAEYQRLVQESESSREQSEAARRALIAHMQTHRCNL